MLFQTFAFLTCHNIECDELHILYIGVSQYFLGSILWWMVFVLLVDTPMANMRRVWELIVAHYQANRVVCQYSTLTISSFIDPNKPRAHYPKLKGRGAEAKWLVGALLHAMRTIRRAGDAIDLRMITALEHLLEMQRILDAHKYDCFFPVEVARDFRGVVDQFLADYTWLGVQADRLHLFLFSGVPKLHWLWHMAHRAHYLNPRRAACFIDEDFVGRVKKIAVRCTAASALHRVPTYVMQKYRWLLHMIGLR